MGKIEDKDIDLHIDRETLLQEYIPRAEFGQRLKADMVAMLKKLQLEIEEMPHIINSWSDSTYIDYNDTWQNIQQKINALEGNNEQ